MDVPTALALWRGLDALAAAHGKTMRVHLAGGEPFRDWTRLVAIIRAARAAGLTPVEKVETNAFWAVDDETTRGRLKELDALGVGKLVVSTDVFHQEFVPFERVRRCVETARELFGPGRVLVRWWDFYRQPVDTAALTPVDREAAFRQALARHRERLCGRAAERLAPLLPGQPAAAFAGQNCAAEILQSRHVHIDGYGHIYPGTCAGIILGRAATAATTVTPSRTWPTVQDIWRALAQGWRDHPVVAALAVGGSHELMLRARSQGYQELPAGYASKCHLCADVRRFLVERGLLAAYVGPPECYSMLTTPAPGAAACTNSPVAGS